MIIMFATTIIIIMTLYDWCSGARPGCSRLGAGVRHPPHKGRLARNRLPGEHHSLSNFKTLQKFNMSLMFKNTPFSAEAGGYLVALHRTAPPPPGPHRGDHRPQVQQVRPQNELGDLGLVLHNFCELRIIRRETLATTLAALWQMHKHVSDVCQWKTRMGYNVFLVISPCNIVSGKSCNFVPQISEK